MSGLAVKNNKLYRLVELTHDEQSHTTMAYWFICYAIFCVYAMVWQHAVERAYSNVDLESNAGVKRTWGLAMISSILFGILEVWNRLHSPGYMSVPTVPDPARDQPLTEQPNSRPGVNRELRMYVRGLVLTLFLSQFPVYMFYAAKLYPHACTFTLMTNGTSYVGDDVKDLQGGEAVTVTWQKYDVDCDDITFYGFAKGGREFFQLMAHAYPMLVLVMVTYTFRDDLPHMSMKKTFIDWFDIQDFWSLFTEDDLIRNYWGRDMCDKYGCGGGSYGLWRFAMFFFCLASIQAILLCVAKIFKAVMKKAPFEEVSAHALNHVQKGFIGASDSNKGLSTHVAFLFVQELTSLLFIDLPFLIIRMESSRRYSIIASTLLAKNCIMCILSLVKLGALICHGSLKILEAYPALNQFEDVADMWLGFKDEPDATVVDEAQDVEPAHLAGDIESPNLS